MSDIKAVVSPHRAVKNASEKSVFIYSI